MLKTLLEIFREVLQVIFKILVVDDNHDDIEVTKMILAKDKDFEVVAETDSSKAIELVRKKPNEFSAVLLDYMMPKDGLVTAKEMFEINPELQIAILSGDQSRTVLKKSIEIGVQSFIDKEDDSEILLGVVRSLCQKWKSKSEVFLPVEATTSSEENEKVIRSLGLVGRSEKLADVCRMIKRAAKVDCSVMILGESGSGKELVARAIHNSSKRKSKPFVGINVSTINENLAESELFGHVKGAFTGAVENSSGKILSAQGGTLFLDEIGDLKPEVQVKLLRVLQERKLSPVGSSKVVDLDIRVISATHVNLEKAIMEGKFREDLYYRLHVFPIHNPPLRERPEDIQVLISHFLKIYKGEDRQLLMKTVRLLERYEWPGNIRELENAIQAMLTFDVKQLTPLHLNQKILGSLNFESDEIPTLHEYQKKLWEMEIEYMERNIRLAGSLREACRSIFKSAPSTIHTRINNLKENVLKMSSTKGNTSEQTI